jgi:hypothetical protein
MEVTDGHLALRKHRHLLLQLTPVACRPSSKDQPRAFHFLGSMGVRSPVVDCGTSLIACLVNHGFSPCVGQAFVVVAAMIGVACERAICGS